MIRSVLQGCYIYWSGIFGLPERIAKQIESIMDKFLWVGPDLTKKLYTINWDAVCKPFEEGGLNIRRLKEMNNAGVLKHLW